LSFVSNGKSLLTPVLISEDFEEVMLGIDWPEERGCVWHFRSKKLIIDGEQTVTLISPEWIKISISGKPRYQPESRKNGEHWPTN